MTKLRKPQSGMTLIEVLVSILIFSFGILGMVGLLARATQFSVDAEDRNRASLLANELAAAMWTAGSVNLPEAIQAAWVKRVSDPQAGGLVGGQGTVTPDPVAGGVRIDVSWTHPGRNPQDPASRNRFTTTVVIE